MFCVGLTGNIASGKSTVANEFKAFGAEIISADVIAKALTLKGEPAYNAIIAHFTRDILLPDGQLDRKALRHLIFSQAEEKKWLENLLHPMIRERIEHRIKTSKAPYVIIEIPLHFNRADYPYINRVLLINANESFQLERLMQRDQCSEEQARALLAHQPDFDTRKTIADDIIENNGDLNALKQQIKLLHARYCTFL